MRGLIRDRAFFISFVSEKIPRIHYGAELNKHIFVSSALSSDASWNMPNHSSNRIKLSRQFGDASSQILIAGTRCGQMIKFRDHQPEAERSRISAIFRLHNGEIATR
jgi:hypothetical protein